MDKKDFDKLITEMQNFYGKRLTPTEIEIYFKELEFMSAPRFNLILDTCYKNNKFMPKLSEILEVHKSISYKVYDNKPKTVIKGNCSICGNSGYVPYWKIINGNKHQYMAVCECGRKQRFDGRATEDETQKLDVYIPTAKEVNVVCEDTKITKEQFRKAMFVLNDKFLLSEETKERLRTIYKNMI